MNRIQLAPIAFKFWWGRFVTFVTRTPRYSAVEFCPFGVLFFRTLKAYPIVAQGQRRSRHPGKRAPVTVGRADWSESLAAVCRDRNAPRIALFWAGNQGDFAVSPGFSQAQDQRN